MPLNELCFQGFNVGVILPRLDLGRPCAPKRMQWVWSCVISQEIVKDAF